MNKKLKHHTAGDQCKIFKYQYRKFKTYFSFNDFKKMQPNCVLGLLRSRGLKLVRSEDDTEVIYWPCLRLPQRGKQVAYALNVHFGAKLDCVYVYLPNFPARPPSLGWVDIGFLLPSLNYTLRTFWPTPLATSPTLAPLSGPGPCP